MRAPPGANHNLFIKESCSIMRAEGRIHMKRILLCCGAGFSSGFLAQKTRAAAKKLGVEIMVDARSESQVPQYLDSIDVLLLGPHFKNQLESYKTMTQGKRVKVDVIPQSIYGTLDGEGLLNLINHLLEGETE